MSNLSQIMCDAWTEAIDSSPDPFRTHLFDQYLGLPRLSYRALLDEPQINGRGQPIPRIAIVRANLRRLGPTRLDPHRFTTLRQHPPVARAKGHGRRRTDWRGEAYPR